MGALKFAGKVGPVELCRGLGRDAKSKHHREAAALELGRTGGQCSPAAWRLQQQRLCISHAAGSRSGRGLLQSILLLQLLQSWLLRLRQLLLLLLLLLLWKLLLLLLEHRQLLLQGGRRLWALHRCTAAAAAASCQQCLQRQLYAAC